ncbi:MAG: radical SAM protein [Clostridiales bacterium]|nr:radical SAM protein [Clostridiales bacterium]
MNYYENCTLCPRNCGVNRSAGRIGYCKMPSEIHAALASVHMWEEPPISGTNGSGTIFFTGCNLRCVFCQNHDISSENHGKAISIDQLAQIMLEEQDRGVHNINLVTAVHYIPSVTEAIVKAKENGLKIPIVYNSGGYEKAESLKMLDGLIDIYLPDIKYFSAELSAKYSAAPDYFEQAVSAVAEMYRQIGQNAFDEKGLLKKGVIIHHLVLPSHKEDSFKVLDAIKENFGEEAYVSLLRQYTPMYRTNEYKEINRRLMSLEYTRVIDHFFDIGLKNGYVQEKSSATSEYTPLFDLSGL